jgi:hypothetical protein
MVEAFESFWFPAGRDAEHDRLFHRSTKEGATNGED